MGLIMTKVTIKSRKKSKYKQINQLSVGDYFKKDGCLHVRTDSQFDSESDVYYAVVLATGHTIAFTKHMDVVPVETVDIGVYP